MKKRWPDATEASFHTYTPNYYVSNNRYFSSGINYSFDSPSKEGLWHHNLTKKSFQVFYGKLEPFMFEFPVPSKLQNKQLQSVRYTSDFLRYTDNISSSLINSLTYNKAVVYNQKQTSGLLELVLKEKNDRRLSIMYPKQNQDSRSILVEYVENGYQFNQFYDVAKPNSNLMLYNCDNPSYTNINPLSIDYSPQPLKRKLTSDYHIIRLINDIHSEYQINHRFSLTRTNNINQ